MRALHITLASTIAAGAVQAQGLGPGGGGGGGVTGGISAALPTLQLPHPFLLPLIALAGAWSIKRFGPVPAVVTAGAAAAGLPAWGILSLLLTAVAASTAVQRRAGREALAVPALVGAFALVVARVEPDQLTPVLASAVGALLSVCLSPVTVTGATVYGPSAFVEIIPACLALEGAVAGFALSSAALLMRGGSARRALFAGALHASVWGLANVLRIVLIGVVVQTSVETAELVHDFGGVLMLLVHAACLAAVLMATSQRRATMPARAVAARQRGFVVATSLVMGSVACDSPAPPECTVDTDCNLAVAVVVVGRDATPVPPSAEAVAETVAVAPSTSEPTDAAEAVEAADNVSLTPVALMGAAAGCGGAAVGPGNAAPSNVDALRDGRADDIDGSRFRAVLGATASDAMTTLAIALGAVGSVSIAANLVGAPAETSL